MDLCIPTRLCARVRKVFAMLACCLTVGAACAFEDTSTMATPEEGRGIGVNQGDARQPIGPWHGNWVVTREHPGIRTRAGALALRLQIEEIGPQALPQIQWVADRAICESPLDEPCEWVGSQGAAMAARVIGGHLLFVLRVSADETDPFVVWLERPIRGRSATGTLISARGDLHYRLQAQRQ